MPVNAISDPSGEKRGDVSTPACDVSRCTREPSGLAVQRSFAYEKAMRFADTAGSLSMRVSLTSMAVAWVAARQRSSARIGFMRCGV